jgi:hypothetical protein
MGRRVENRVNPSEAYAKPMHGPCEDHAKGAVSSPCPLPSNTLLVPSERRVSQTLSQSRAGVPPAQSGSSGVVESLRVRCPEGRRDACSAI